jgi:hypothetical protein
MFNANSFQMRPLDVTAVATHLDALADRIVNWMGTEPLNLTVTALGRDEVSQRVAATLNDVHTGYRQFTQGGVEELREVSATVRAPITNVLASDGEFASLTA